MNRAIAGYLARVKFQEPPFTNSLELVDAIRAVTPPELAYLIEDLFETITLYDNRALSASVTQVDAATYEVTLRVAAKKLRAGELGEEREQPMNDLVDVGAVDADNLPLVLERRQIKSGTSEVTFRVGKLPAKAGIDPLNKLIDRLPGDNLVPVDLSLPR